MINKINDLLAKINDLKANSNEELEALRIKYLSKKGEISSLMNDFRNVAAEQKREIGQKLNELKENAQEKINLLKEALENHSSSDDFIDLTRTAYPYHVGTRHPLSIVKKEICDIFGRLGFSIAEGPEIEDDWHVFSSLNFAADHPARDMQDTFFIQHGVDILL
jgi:phenylalanyl-tRNA synthetase alpha chain